MVQHADPNEQIKQTQFRLLPHVTITCGGTEILALVDSGCINEEYFDEICHHSKFPILPVTSTQLRGAMGHQSVHIRWQAWSNFEFANVKQSFSHVFLVVKNLVRPIIIGIDWLTTVQGKIDLGLDFLEITVDAKRYRILFNVNTQCLDKPELERTGESLSVEACAISCSINMRQSVATVEEIQQKVNELTSLTKRQRGQLLSLLQSFQPLFNKYPGRTDKYQHVIKMHDTSPFVKRPYPIPISLRPQVDATIKEMLDLGVIKRESSQYASPVTVARKKDGSVRVCLDARTINARMVADHEAPTPPEEIFNSLTSIKYMSAIDLRSSYWQIPLSPESTQYTAFLYNGKTYTYLVFPFGKF